MGERRQRGDDQEGTVDAVALGQEAEQRAGLRGLAQTHLIA
jgi:hypothetical protein